LEEENIKIIEEEREQNRLRESKQQFHDSFSYKDTETKTFYTKYIQQKYTVAEQPFPERNTFTINIKNEQINENLNDNYFNSSCPECGKFIVQQK